MNRFDKRRVSRIRFDAFSQLRYVLVERATVREIVLAPTMPKDDSSVQRATGVFEEQLQNTNVAETKFNHILAPSSPQFGWDDSQSAHIEFGGHIRLPRTTASSDRLDPSHNFPDTEGFDNEIVGTDFESHQSVKLFRFRADEDDGNIG